MNNILKFKEKNTLDLISKVEEYRNLNRKIKELTKTLSQMKKEIIDETGRGEITNESGLVIAEVYSTIRTSFDLKSFEKENEEMASQYKKKSETALSIRLK